MDTPNLKSKGGGPNLPLQERINSVDRMYRSAAKGKKAEDVLSILDPILEQRLGVLLDGFRQAPPELGALLDFRAQLCEVWRMRKELRSALLEGKSAEATLEGLLEVAMRSNQPDVSGNRTNERQ